MEHDPLCPTFTDEDEMCFCDVALAAGLRERARIRAAVEPMYTVNGMVYKSAVLLAVGPLPTAAPQDGPDAAAMDTGEAAWS